MSVVQKTMTVERGYKVGGSSSSGGGDFSKQAVQVIRDMHDKREHEKHELQVLNVRFNDYIGRVRELEAMNKRLIALIEELKGKWGLDSGKVKFEMEPGLLKIRESIDEVTKLKAVAEIQARRAESDALQFKNLMELALDSYRGDKNKIKNLEASLENNRHDLEYLRSQMNDMSAQINKYIDEQKRLYSQLNVLKDEFDRETLVRVGKQNEVQTLEEQIAFLKAVHEQEISELSRLQTIVGFDPAQFYRTELERAIRDIRGDFDQLNQEQKRELEAWYRIKTEEVEKEMLKEKEMHRMSHTGLSIEESNNLKSVHSMSQSEYVELQRRHGELAARLRELEEKLESAKSANQMTYAEKDRAILELREKISELMATYDELMSRKTSLEFEINTYRRLLECEESRFGKAKPVELVKVEQSEGSSMESSFETITRRMAVTKTSKGPVGIKEISREGKYVMVENTGKRGDMDISRWSIVRHVDKEPEITFIFPLGTIIGSGRTIKVWSKGQGAQNMPFEMVNDAEWKAGESMVTKLFSETGEERAFYGQSLQLVSANTITTPQ